MSLIKRSVSATASFLGRNIKAMGALLGVLIFSGFIFGYCTNFGKPYVSASSGSQLQLTLWFFRWPHLFRATYEIDAMNKWEAAGIKAFFSRDTQVYCRNGQVRLMIDDGKPVYLQDSEDNSAVEGDIRVEAGKLIMAAVKKAMNVEHFLDEPPAPKESGKPTPST